MSNILALIILVIGGSGIWYSLRGLTTWRAKKYEKEMRKKGFLVELNDNMFRGFEFLATSGVVTALYAVAYMYNQVWHNAKMAGFISIVCLIAAFIVWRQAFPKK